MSEPLQDFVARFAWRFVPSAREDTQVEAAGAEGEDPAGDVGAGNAGDGEGGTQGEQGALLDPGSTIQHISATSNVGGARSARQGNVLDTGAITQPTTVGGNGGAQQDSHGDRVAEAPAPAILQRGRGHGSEVVHVPGEPATVSQHIFPRGRAHGGRGGQQGRYQVQHAPRANYPRGQENTRGGGRAGQQGGRGRGHGCNQPAAQLLPGSHGDRAEARGIDYGAIGGIGIQQGHVGGRRRGQGNTQQAPQIQPGTQETRGGARGIDHGAIGGVQQGHRGGRDFAFGNAQDVPVIHQGSHGGRGRTANPPGSSGGRGRGHGGVITDPSTAGQGVSHGGHSQGPGATRGGQQGSGGGRGDAQQALPTGDAAPAATQQQDPLHSLQGLPQVPVPAPQSRPLNLEGNPRNRPWAERWNIRQMRRRQIDALSVEAAWFSSEFTNLTTQRRLPMNIPRARRETRTPVPDVPDPAVVAPPTPVETSTMPAENDLFEREDGGYWIGIWNPEPQG